MTDSDRDRKQRWTQTHAAIERAFNDLTIPPDDYTTIRQYVQNEAAQLYEHGSTSFIIFGSYRNDYQRRLRLVQYELSKPTTWTAILIGDIPDPELSCLRSQSDPLGFLLKLHLFSSFADRLVGVYEKDSGGEAPELGVISHDPYFKKTRVFPRDYGLDGEPPLAKDDVIRQAVTIWFTADSGDKTRRQKLKEIRGLLVHAQENDVSITETEIVEILEQREADGFDEHAHYSWVHLSAFRKFEQHGRCHTWWTTDDLRRTVPLVYRQNL